MNTRKAYRMLIVVLFFAFISLISRSIVYLILSVVIATIIVFLLSNAKKKDNKNSVEQQTEVTKKKRNSFIGILSVIMGVGVLLVGYGSLYFWEKPNFLQLIPLPEQLVTVMILFAVGCLVVLGCLYFMIKETFTVDKN